MSARSRSGSIVHDGGVRFIVICLYRHPPIARGILSTEMSRDVAIDAMRLKALGHPVRLGIALALARDPGTCACDFADVFDVSQPTVSEHLRVLREARLVTTRRRGTQIVYSLD